MLAKWKTLLTNWINCYFKGTEDRAQYVTTDSLLNIITHLRENFSLDESKTSLLQASTLEEFITEKYPEFFFANGIVEPKSEDEICMVASLLLFFVCVTSKDTNIKNAMCQKLSPQDQETILKFNKSLMESTAVTRRDVENAILEACGQELASAGDLQLNIASTPPALRSLHGEVRRLHAALDAERFDRNYLQEELARSHDKIDKLKKEKEQYKLEITSLRAKASEVELQDEAPADPSSNAATRMLMRQVEDLEQRLLDIRSQLDDMIYERDTYKKKVEDLKLERDKWVSSSQQESLRADSAQELLDAEMKTTESLKELVAELRQHNRHNGIDTSQLECDDPDASVHSFVNNASVCSEACANIIEVQLSEEKNKTTELRQQIQSLQDQLVEMSDKYELERCTLEAVIRQRDNEISDHKHRLNEEIHEKNGIKSQLNEESARLNNEINELEQKIKIITENYHTAIESKLAEIQTLQEEKLSLLESLHNETTKLEGIIKTHETTISQLTDQLYTEKNQMQKMKEDYENRMMKLNEKVLNRNNELVELQNNVCQKGEKIENLQLEVKKEKENTENLIAKYNQDIEIANTDKALLEGELRQKASEINQMQCQLQETQSIADRLADDLSSMKKINESLNADINFLEETKEQLKSELIARDDLLENLQQDFERTKQMLDDERQSFRVALDEKKAMVENLQKDLTAVKAVRTGLQEEVQQLYDARRDLTDELNRLSADLEKARQQLYEKDRIIDAIDMHLNEEKMSNSSLRENIDELNMNIGCLTNQLARKEEELVALGSHFDNKYHEMKLTIDENINVIELLKSQIGSLEHDMQELVCVNNLLNEEKNNLYGELSFTKENEARLAQVIENLNTEKLQLNQQISDFEEKYNLLQNNHDSDRSKLTTRINETERILKDLRTKTNSTIKSKNNEIDDLQKSLTKLNEELATVKQETAKYSHDIGTLQHIIVEKDAVIATLKGELGSIQTEKETLLLTLDEKIRAGKVIEEICDKLTDTLRQFELVTEENKITHDQSMKQSREEIQSLDTLLCEANNNLSKLQIEFTKNTKKLRDEISELKKSYETKNEELNNVRKELENEVSELKKSYETKNEELNNVREELEKEVTELKDDLERMKSKYNDITVERQELTSKLALIEESITLEKEQTTLLVNELNAEKEALTQQLLERASINNLLIEEKNNLINEKEILTQQMLEAKSTIEIILNEKAAINTHYNDLLNCKNEIENQLIDEKGIRDELEKEKSMLVEQLSVEVSSNSNLKQGIKYLELENNNCVHKLATVEELQNKLKDELTAIVKDNEVLRKQLADEKAKLQALVEEKEGLIAEKTTALESLSEGKITKDLLESEKNQVIAMLEVKHESAINDLKSNEEELTKVNNELRSLRQDYNELQESVDKTQSVLNSKLKDVLEILTNENILNSELNKITSDKNYQDLPLFDQSTVILNFIDLIIPHLINKNINVNDLKATLKEKEGLIKKLEIMNADLENTITADKAEFDQRSKHYTKSLEAQAEQLRKLQQDNSALTNELNDVKINLDVKVHSLKEKLVENENLTDKLKSTYECQIDNLNVMTNKLTSHLKDKSIELDTLRKEKDRMQGVIEENNQVIKSLQDELKAVKQQHDKLISEFDSERQVLKNMVTVTESIMEDQKQSLDRVVSANEKVKHELQDEIAKLKDYIKLETLRYETILKEKEEAFQNLFNDYSNERKAKDSLQKELVELERDLKERSQELKVSEEAYSKTVQQLQEFERDITATVKSLDDKLKIKEDEFTLTINEKEAQINRLSHLACEAKDKVTKLNRDLNNLNEEHIELNNEKAEIEKDAEQNRLLLNQVKIENKSLNEEIERNNLAIASMNDEIVKLQAEIEIKKAENEQNQKQFQIEIEANIMETKLLKEEIEKLKVTAARVELLEKELQEKQAAVDAVNKALQEETLAKQVVEQELTYVREFIANQEIMKSKHLSHSSHGGTSPGHHKQRKREHREQRDPQVDMSTSDLASSLDSNRTINDLERILYDKNHTITTLQHDLTYLKTLMADSENKLLDVTKDLEASQENCHQLSTQLKKVVQQKNEEIAELKKQLSKMTVTENRASQIIKVSAKYQAIILKRIAEIKQNTVLKELTNFGNPNVDNELRKSIADVTMEDLENFLETTDKHLKRCYEKQAVLQKERDRLVEINRIQESELINMKKFLTELSVSFKTLTSLKEMYTQKLSRVISIQRTVRRELLNLDNNVSDGVMCSLERGYAASMQDMTECVMNLERWMERSIGRTISPEKLKLAVTGDLDRVSLASTSFQNTSLEVQLEELEGSFQKLLEEVLRAHKAGKKDPQASTVMEVRAEYEDKLNRMKAKMKQLYQEQIAIFREKQKEEIEVLERDLKKAQEKLSDSSRAYEEHIRGLTAELWSVGEKFLVKKDEAEWLRKRQQQGSLMSLQHLPTRPDEARPSDVSSLRSLPMHGSKKNDRRGFHMSDEEGEVFDNRFLKDLDMTPRNKRSPPPKGRLSELKFRNSLCPPHLKSSYPAETQFTESINEEDIKQCVSTTSSAMNVRQRKEVGITAYKKPGPPTPSKNAGRLSATDCELRESLRVEPSPAFSRKTTTPSRIRSLFFSNKNDTNDGTPRRRLGIFRNKKQ